MQKKKEKNGTRSYRAYTLSNNNCQVSVEERAKMYENKSWDNKEFLRVPGIEIHLTTTCTCQVNLTQG